MDKLSYISNADVTAIENIYEQYLINAESVDFGFIGVLRLGSLSSLGL